MSLDIEQLKTQMMMLKQIVMHMDPIQRKQFALFCMGLFKEIFEQK